MEANSRVRHTVRPRVFETENSVSEDVGTQRDAEPQSVAGAIEIFESIINTLTNRAISSKDGTMLMADRM